MLPKIFGCLEDLKTLSDDSLIKQCLLLDELSNPNCEAPLAETLDKASLTLVLEGDVGAQYTAGTSIALKDANGNVCGSATAAATPAPVFNDVANTTTIAIEDCELSAGKTAADVTQAKPVLQATAMAVKAVVTNVSLLSLKKSAAAVRTKEEVVENVVRGE